MAPPRHRRKRRPARVVSAPVPVEEPEPEPAPMPPRRGLMASLMGGPPRPVQPRPSMVAPATLGPPWKRVDYYVLSGLTAAVIVVVGLLLGFTDSTSSTVRTSGVPAPTTTSFSVASGAGKSFLCGAGIGITVGGTQDTVASIDGDRITLTQPLASPPASGASVTQGMLAPATVQVCAAVASSPKPTTTQITLAGGAGQDFVASTNSSQSAIYIDGQQDTVKSIDATTYRLTLKTPLAAPPVAGTPVTQGLYATGGLIGGVVGLAISEIAILVLAVAALVARPIASRMRRKPRPRMTETLVFGAVIAVVDTLVYYLEVSALGSSITGAGIPLAELAATASGFVLVPLIYPTIGRMFRRQPRRAPVGRSGR